MATSCEQVNLIVTDFLSKAKEALASIITAMQSDQLLEQMRNDQNLYFQKLIYIQEIIKDQFNIQPLNSNFIHQITELKHKNIELQLRLEQSREEYISELSTIQIQYKQFLIEKQNEKKHMQKQIQLKNGQIFTLKKEFSTKVKKIELQNQKLKEQIQKLNTRQEDLKIDIEESQKIKQKLHQDINALRSLERQTKDQKRIKNSQIQKQNKEIYKINSELKSQNNQLNQKLQQMNENLNIFRTEEQTYIQTIQNMKQDMFLIRQEWEKRCIEVQRDQAEDYRAKLIDHEEQMNQQLQSYIEDLKLGKNIIIQSSQEILQSKRMLIQQRFNQELKRYEKQLELQTAKAKDLQLKHAKLKDDFTIKDKELMQVRDQYEVSIKNKENLMNRKQQELTLKLNHLRNQSQKQIQRLRKTEGMLLKEIKFSKQQKDDIQKQISLIRQEFESYKQKQQRQSVRLKELQTINELSSVKILQMKKDMAILNQKNSLNQRSLKEKNNQIFRLETNLNQIKAQYKEVETIARKLQLRVAENNLKSRQSQRVREDCLSKIQKLYLLIRKLTKQLTLAKQDIIFLINVDKNKLSTIIFALNEEINIHSENLLYKNKLKIRQILDNVELQSRQEKQQFDLLYRQNQNMKKQIKLMQQIMDQKEQDHVYSKERIVNLEVQKCRLLMQDSVNKERDEKRKVEEKLYNQQKNHQYMISKAEKQVSKTVKQFMSKWENKFNDIQQSLQIKQKYLKQTSQYLKKVLAQLQNAQQRLHNAEQKLGKQQRKYENLRQQRDKTVDQMMKRLEKQTKHKLTLERELKQIRGELMKTQTTSTSSPFNNYSFTDRQNTTVYTNAFQAKTQQKHKNQTKTNQRQKQLSQIREMIAKTYKVVQGPEKDSPVHKAKLF